MRDAAPRGLPADLIAVLASGTVASEGQADWQAMLEACIEHVSVFDAGSVLERTEDGTLRFVAGAGFDLGPLAPLRIPPSALHRSEPDGMLLGPRLNVEALDAADRTAIEASGNGRDVMSSLSVAIRPGGRLVGYLQFDARHRTGFDEEDLAVASAIGDLMSARVERSRLRLQLVRAMRDVERVSTHDPVTGLPNRDLLLDRLGQAVARDQRAERTTALLLVALRDMHGINDAYGRGRGNEVLRTLARNLGLATREMDTVAHLGGGEFAILASGIEAVDATEALVGRIDELSGQPIEFRDVTLHPRLALGVAIYPHDAASPSELVRNAELALSRALADDRRSVTWFMHDVDREERERARLAEELRAALISGQGVWVAFQPVHRMADRACIGIEALARWDRATPGDAMVPPSVFGPLTEELGLTHELSSRVYDRAFRVFASLGSLRGERRWRLGLNVSASQLRDDDLVALLRDLTERHDVPIEEIDLEVPSPIVFEAGDGALQRLRTLRELGCRIVVDDFAARRDELERLEGLPLDALKIHPRWTRSPDEDLPRRRITGIVSAAERLRLGVIAEGVETPDAARHLADLGVGAMQGFFATPPMHAAALLAYLSGGSPEG